MIFFPPLRLRRATLQLRELSIAESIGLASIASEKEQEAQAFLIDKAVESNKGTLDDLNLLTIQERLHITTHYLACVSIDGPNFSVGDESRFSDYFDGENDLGETVVKLGELEGDDWSMGHLLGGDALAIERVKGAIERIEPRFHWILGAMACQLIRTGEEKPSSYNAAFDDWLVNRMKVLSAIGEGGFLALVALWQQGLEKLHHLFRIEFDDHGILVLPKEVDSALPPARFRTVSCVSEFAQRMAGRAF